MEDYIEKYLNLIQEQKNIKARLLVLENKKVHEAVLVKESKKVFDKYPNVKSFGWKQYTPSWNDGDVCYFHCNLEDVIINYIDLKDEDEDEYNEDVYSDVQDAVNVLPSEVYERVFSASGAEILITRKGEVKENYYEHY